VPKVEWTLERDDPRTGDTESIPGVLSGTYIPPTDDRSYSHGEVKDFTFRVTATGQYLRLVGAEMNEARDALREAGHENYLIDRSYVRGALDFEDPYDDPPTPSDNYGDYDADYDPPGTWFEAEWGPAARSNRSQQESYLRDDLLACDPLPPPTAWKRLLRDEEF
jgi:hypothetical protein